MAPPPRKNKGSGGSGFARLAAALCSLVLTSASPLPSRAPGDLKVGPSLFWREGAAPGQTPSSADEVDVSSPSFFPGDEAVILERGEADRRDLRLARRSGSGWSSPELLSFSGKWRDFEPAVSTDGRSVVFASSRPVYRTGAPLDGHWSGQVYPGHGGNIWKVEHLKNGGWSAPERLPEVINSGTSVFEPALAADGTMYFMRPDPVTDKFRLYVARRRKGQYLEAAEMLFWTPDIGTFDPAVAPDQSYLVFCSGAETPGRAALFISFNGARGWSQPRRLPDTAVGRENLKDVHLSADQRQLYFTRGNAIWKVPFQPILAWARKAATKQVKD